MNIEENQISDTELQIEKELAAFRAEEAEKLGLGRGAYKEKVHTTFTASQVATTTIWVSGLTLAHDHLVAASLRGVGYNVETIDAADNTALNIGKEFGNRGQCNPTYFTVGNLVKKLIQLRDEQGMPTAEIISRFVFLTAGACGPCRFGTYVTEYRKALRDAGFDGFRVMLFQQQGGVKQATGDEIGLKINLDFAKAVIQALVAGDVVNLLGYRLRPYETQPGSVDAVVEQSKAILAESLSRQGSTVAALARCRMLFSKVSVDRTQPKPLVSLIGEFWAMTTEGDGNYHMQRFLEKEGAEVDIQGITNWILFMVWENRYDTLRRISLKEADGGRKGLDGKNPTQKLWVLAALDRLIRGWFQLYAQTIGLHGYHLPDMGEIAELSKEHYSNEVRGGEAHMEVGKVIHFAKDKVNHMTLSVKPFGCMPSSGVSDGVQSVVTARYPEAIFLPIETTGDGAVNVYSRVQMMLFKARQKAEAELNTVLAETGLSREELRRRVQGSRRWRSPLAHPPHKAVGVAANLAYAVS
jgi:predicted nucleotide-binding protein (sugar kinase/HSP70/actin superfamily)